MSLILAIKTRLAEFSMKDPKELTIHYLNGNAHILATTVDILFCGNIRQITAEE